MGLEFTLFSFLSGSRERRAGASSFGIRVRIGAGGALSRLFRGRARSGGGEGFFHGACPERSRRGRNEGQGRDGAGGDAPRVVLTKETAG